MITFLDTEWAQSTQLGSMRSPEVPAATQPQVATSSQVIFTLSPLYLCSFCGPSHHTLECVYTV